MNVERWYRQQHRFVWRSLRRMGVPPDGLEDAVQEVFIVAARRRAEFEGRSSVKTWLFSIALGVVRNERRARFRHRRRIAALAWFQDAFLPRRSAGHDRVELMDLLMALDEDQRAIVVLMDLEGMSAREVAEATGLSMHGIYRRHKSAREELERMFTAPATTPGGMQWTG